MCPIITAIAENYSVVIVDIKFENDAWKGTIVTITTNKKYD